MALPTVQHILDLAAAKRDQERDRKDGVAQQLSDHDGRPAVGWPDRLLMALIREHPEYIPDGLLDYLNRGRVNRSSLDPDERSAGPSR